MLPPSPLRTIDRNRFARGSPSRRLAGGIRSPPFWRVRRYPESFGQATDPIVAAETDQVQSSDPGQMDGMVGELTGDLEALGLGVQSGKALSRQASVC